MSSPPLPTSPHPGNFPTHTPTPVYWGGKAKLLGAFLTWGHPGSRDL